MEEIRIGDGYFMFYGYPLEQLIANSRFNQIYGITTSCSASWRGYKGEWGISSDELFLGALVKDPCDPCAFEAKYSRRKTFDLKKIIPNYDIKTNYYHKADWFSGEIVIPISEYRDVKGKKNKSGHNYSEHQVIVYLIKKGNVESREIEYRER